MKPGPRHEDGFRNHESQERFLEELQHGLEIGSGFASGIATLSKCFSFERANSASLTSLLSARFLNAVIAIA